MQEQAWGGKWMTLSEAASALGVSVITLRRSLKRGLLDGHQVVTKHGPTWLVWIDRVPEGSVPTALDAEDPVIQKLVHAVARLEESNRIMSAEMGRLRTQLDRVQVRVDGFEEQQYGGPGSSQL